MTSHYVMHSRTISGGRVDERDSLTVEKYWGDINEDPDGWLFHVQTVSELKGWDEQRRVQRAVVALTGRARTEYQSFKMNHPNNPITWAQFEEFIRREFGPSDPIDYYNRKLSTIRQGSQETVSEYNSKFRVLLAKLQNVQEDRYPPRALVLYYIDGLRHEFQEDTERGKPQTLAAAYEGGEHAERIWRRKMCPRSSAGVYAVTSEKPAVDTGPPAKKPAKEDDPLVKELKDLVGRNAEMIASNQKTIQLLLEQQKNQTSVAGKSMAQSGYGRGKTNFGGSCYYCKKPGHRMSECFKRQADVKRNPGGTSGKSQEFSRSKPQEHGPSTGRTVNVVRGPCDTAERESGLPFCELTIEGIESVTCILDTGSVASIISDLFAGRVGKLSSMAPSNQRNLTAADGGALTVLGSLSLQLALGDFDFQYTFEVVKDFQPTVLLGGDFLRHFKVVLDYKHGSVVLSLAPGKKVRLRLCGLFLDNDGLGRADAGLLRIEDIIGRACAVTAPDHTYATTTRIPQSTPTIVDLEAGETLSWKPSSRVRISKELTAQRLGGANRQLC